MIHGLTGEFGNDEKLLMDYTIQQITYKKRSSKFQLIILFSVILIFITLAIFTFSVILKDKNLRSEYGDYYHCYMCGYINGKTCNCNFIPSLALNADDNYFIKLGENNAVSCEKTLS